MLYYIIDINEIRRKGLITLYSNVNLLVIAIFIFNNYQLLL